MTDQAPAAPQPGDDRPIAAAMTDFVAGVWQRLRPRVLQRLDDLDAALAQARCGDLDDPVRAAALVEAHKLAGSLGTYGFHAASDAARQAEQVLERDPLDVAALERALHRLRAELDG